MTPEITVHVIPRVKVFRVGVLGLWVFGFKGFSLFARICFKLIVFCWLNVACGLGFSGLEPF